MNLVHIWYRERILDRKKGLRQCRNPLKYLVELSGIEPLTS